MEGVTRQKWRALREPEQFADRYRAPDAQVTAGHGHSVKTIMEHQCHMHNVYSYLALTMSK
jgi:hypothetical protein